MSSSSVIYFMYHHYQHCVLKKSLMPDKSPDSFTLFPHLPAELRLKIWQTVASEPHQVELSCTPTASHIPSGRWFSHSKPPIIFRICSESRAAALSRYSDLTFSAEQIGVPCPHKLYINFSADTLWLCADLHVKWARDLLEKNEQLKEKLRFLAVNEKVWKELNEVNFSPSWNLSISTFPSTWQESVPIRARLCALEDVRFHS